jgi:hypothetical protein
MALGASGALMTCRTSSRLRHLAVPEAARAHPNALGRPVDQRANCLEIGFKPSGSHIVRVGNRPPDNRPFVTDLTPFRHVAVLAQTPVLNASGGFIQLGGVGSPPDAQTQYCSKLRAESANL